MTVSPLFFVAFLLVMYMHGFFIGTWFQVSSVAAKAVWIVLLTWAIVSLTLYQLSH